MAVAARARGYKVIAITDHTSGLGVVQGMTEEDLKERLVEIEQARQELGDSIQILNSAEVEIRSDGSLDYSDEVLSSLDLVIASLHSSLRQARDKITQRLLKAMCNPHVDIIGHPTGRLMPNREGADLDMDAVLATAAETGVAMEINAHPARLDLDDVYAKRAIELGIKLSINTDAHDAAGLDLMHFGVSTARRGWVEAKDVINTWSQADLMKWLKSRG